MKFLYKKSVSGQTYVEHIDQVSTNILWFRLILRGKKGTLAI